MKLSEKAALAAKIAEEEKEAYQRHLCQVETWRQQQRRKDREYARYYDKLACRRKRRATLITLLLAAFWLLVVPYTILAFLVW